MRKVGDRRVVAPVITLHVAKVLVVELVVEAKGLKPNIKTGGKLIFSGQPPRHALVVAGDGIAFMCRDLIVHPTLCHSTLPRPGVALVLAVPGQGVGLARQKGPLGARGK